MKDKDVVAYVLSNIERTKKEAKKILGKDSNFTVKDFEKYMSTLYNVTFYKSMADFIKNEWHIDCTDDEVIDYVDCLFEPLISVNHRVAYIKDKHSNRSCYFCYVVNQNMITQIHSEGNYHPILLDGFNIFEKNGEEATIEKVIFNAGGKKNFDRWKNEYLAKSNKTSK